MAHLWQACTQMRDHMGSDPAIPLIGITQGEGAYLIAEDGKRYLDAVSSWWTTLWGHCHPQMVAAIQAQVATLDHVMLAGFTHPQAARLAERLCTLTGHDRCFLTDNGSSAIEAALKMSFHYWHNTGKPQKQRFLALTNSYHGETLGALAVGGPSMYRDIYAPLLHPPLFAPSPDCFTRPVGTSWEDHCRRSFAHLEHLLAQHHAEIAAVVVEPLVQCAGGMRMYHGVYLTLLREACTRYGVHLIADEIAVGFGRTGTLWACEQAPPLVHGKGAAHGITPDFICLSKGLTGGTLPLAAVLTSNRVYEAFLDTPPTAKSFLHSHSYSGNAIACAAANASLDLWEQQSPLAANRVLAQLLWAHTAPLRSHRHVAEVRQTGLILAVEMQRSPHSRVAFPAAERRGLIAYRHALSRGVILRPLGDVLYLMPPYIWTSAEAKLACEVLCEAVDAATAA